MQREPGCKPGKHPLIPNGHVGATTDLGQIRLWWSRWPDANIGIPAGERSGLLILDVDVDHHGFASLNALEEEHGQFPKTLTVRTGGGGIHIYLKYPPGCEIRNSVGRVGLGLDVRGEGGYTIAPPSRTDKARTAGEGMTISSGIMRRGNNVVLQRGLGHRDGAKRRPRQSRRPSAAKSIIRAEVPKDTDPRSVVVGVTTLHGCP